MDSRSFSDVQVTDSEEVKVRSETLDTGRSALLRLDVEVVTDVDRFESLRREWDHLVELSPATPFQLFDWSFLWWKHFGEQRNRTLHILLFRSEERLVGIAPLLLETTSFAGWILFRRMRFLACDVAGSVVKHFFTDYPPTDYFDLIVLPGYRKEVAQAFVGYLEEHKDLFDEVQLANLQHSSFAAVDFVQRMVVSGLSHKITRADVCPRIVLEGSFEDYLRSIDGNHRRRLRQAKRASHDEGVFSLRNPSSLDEIRKAFSELVRLHQRRWNMMGSPGLFYEKRFEMLQREFADVLLGKGRLWLRSAHGGERTIAVRLAFVFKGVYYDYITGVDDECEEARRRPGTAIFVDEIEDAIRSGARVVDMMRGGEQYKIELANDLRYNWNIVVLNPHSVFSARVRIVRALEQGGQLLHRLLRECLMLKISCSFHGVPAGIVRYVKARAEKLVEKIEGSMHKPLAGTVNRNIPVIRMNV